MGVVHWAMLSNESNAHMITLIKLLVGCKIRLMGICKATEFIEGSQVPQSFEFLSLAFGM